MKMKTYWMNDLKKTEKAVYIGHIAAKDKMYGIDKDIQEKIDEIRERNDMEGLRFSSLRDLSDEYRCRPGSYFGCDVWLIVKPGYFKKNKELIEKFKGVFLEV